METTEYRRFTLTEANAGDAAGWTLASGWWFTWAVGWCAWFRRETS